jgi:hypothetical protein
MSALPPIADTDEQGRDVRFVPKADIKRCDKLLCSFAPIEDFAKPAQSSDSLADRGQPLSIAQVKTIRSSWSLSVLARDTVSLDGQ